jgi:DNA gyrase subunit A
MTTRSDPPGDGGSGNLVPVNIEDEMRASYLDYAMSVIIGRALPDARDGLKPVHRRVLFAMQELGNHYNRAYKKSARVVGDVIGKYHPHGDQAVYDTIVRMAQDFSMRHLLVDGQGNFGSVDGDPPAAMRYTEVRMTKLTSEMLADLEKDTVDFGSNYDDSLQEPLVLPNRFPNLLVNGSSGIAVGMATNIPPHNLGEIISATIALIETPDLSVAQLMAHVPGPDFPTAGIIYGTEKLTAAYETGRGTIRIRGRVEVVEGPKNDRILITELPYQVNKANLLEKTAGLVRDKKIEGIQDIRDESNRVGMRVVIDLKRDANSDVILNRLYSLTALQSSFGFNMLAIVNGQPQTLSLKDLLEHFIVHRREVVTRRSRFELREAHKRFNVIFGLLAAIDSIDRIIKIIRGSKDSPSAKAALLEQRLELTPTFKTFCESVITFDFEQGGATLASGHISLNERQAQAILDMRLARLTGLEREKLVSEAEELREVIEHLSSILDSDELLLQVIVEELQSIHSEYANPRRTELVAHGRLMSVEDLIADEDMVITVSHTGYVKRTPVDLYSAQRRGGRGKTAARTRDEDFVEEMFVASTHSYVLVFTDRGKVYWLKVYEIPQIGRSGRGKPMVNLIKIAKAEKIAAVLPVREFCEGSFLVFVTALGYIKKTDIMAFDHPRPSGLKALSIDDNDQLISVGLTDGSQEILMGTRQGMAIRFPENNVRPMGRSARGVRAIKLKKEGDRVVGAVILSEDSPTLLTITDNGFGKRTPISDYRSQSRGGSGIISSKVTSRTGEVAGISSVSSDGELMVVTTKGMMIRVKIDEISVLGRSTQGVKIITTTAQEQVAGLAKVAENG